MPRASNITPNQPWQDVAKKAQEYRDVSIAQVEPRIDITLNALPKDIVGIPKQLLSEEEVRITEMLPEDLLVHMATGEFTATAVTRAFLRRAALAQKLTNCITELLPERALSRAARLDAYFATHGKTVGPLHGLPISVKEHIGMKDLTLCAAYVAWYGKIATSDASVLQILWEAGAVFHARTTEPQSTMHLETDSNLWGVTVNPYNTSLSAGGSSGGEGALIGLRGSCLGIGTDIGGSIRSPAAHNGIYGLKPTAFRIPSTGWSDPAPGADPISSVIGPMSTSLAGLALFMKTVISAKPWLTEPALIPLPWSPVEVTTNTPIKIGVMYHDAVVLPHPPITRALNLLVSKLQQLSNVEIVEWKPHLHDEAWAIISSLYYPDGGAADVAIMKEGGEPMLPLTKWIITDNPCVKKLTVEKLEYWLEEKEEYRREYANAWNDTGFDVILCPVAPGVAPKHNTAKYWGYTSQWNLLDYPAVVFPVTKVDREEDVVAEGYVHTPMSEVDTDNWDLYDSDEFHGLPVSLQMVARRFEDEKVLGVLEYVKHHVGLPFAQFP